MKFVKWKILIITCIVCLSPILLGVALWNDLPDTMAIHFNINNEPDSFASKSFVVFAIPCLMVLFQIFCCTISDIEARKHGISKKFETASKWIIPTTTVVLYVITLGYGMGWEIDIRKAALFIVGWIFLVIGNYIPKLDYIKNYNIDTHTARKINRFCGYIMVIMGILALITIFLPPFASVIWLFSLIPLVAVITIYTITASRK